LRSVAQRSKEQGRRSREEGAEKREQGRRSRIEIAQEELGMFRKSWECSGRAPRGCSTEVCR